MCLAVREWEAEAKRIGRKEGLNKARSQGELLKLIELIRLKMQKDKRLEQIIKSRNSIDSKEVLSSRNVRQYP